MLPVVGTAVFVGGGYFLVKYMSLMLNNVHSTNQYTLDLVKKYAEYRQRQLQAGIEDLNLRKELIEKAGSGQPLNPLQVAVLERLASPRTDIEVKSPNDQFMDSVSPFIPNSEKKVGK